MTRDDDEDALRWEGDDEKALAPGWKRVGGTAPRGDAAGDATPAEDAEAAADAPDARERDAAGAGDAEAGSGSRRQAGSVELVVLGVLGGVYLLYTLGWLLTAVRSDASGMGVLGDVMYRLGLWLAVAAPALWFGLVSAVARRPRVRLAWLAAGAIALVPLPFILGVAS
ncbi:hypothetical protein ACDF64_16580 [Agromyces sp. MMS24-JH15]|uniref:hypothetical protein n=1 Tax=Agromyces sp. MMS24-JH15 TaxID=3243765 RepID=UPI00374A9773